MNFAQLIVVFLALNLVPDDANRFTLNQRDQELQFTRQSDSAWNYTTGGENSAAEPVSLNGFNMQVSHQGQVTINFMQQYVGTTAETDWSKIKSVPIIAVKPPGTVTLDRKKKSIQFVHEHDQHPFEGRISWEEPDAKK